MSAREDSAGSTELHHAIGQSRRLLWAVGLFSVFANLLMLTGPLFMLQVYDRVLASGSVETLTALFLLVTGLFLIFGLLEFARGRVMARVGARAQATLSQRVEAVSFAAALRGRADEGDAAPRDLSALQRALASPAPFVLFDMPWVPVFLAAMFVFHPWLGVLGVCGGLVMVAITVLNQMRSRASLEAAQQLEAQADQMADGARRQVGAVRALGMTQAVLGRIDGARQAAVEAGVTAGDRSGAYAAASKSMRFYLQSAVLALGAALAIAGAITPGAMIAASILMGRALAPLEQGIAQWPVIQRGLAAWRRLRAALDAAPAEEARTALPNPVSQVNVRNLTVTAPETGILTLIGINVDILPGQALGVIGPSASGKSSLARALANVWSPAAGSIRLDGATLEQWPGDALGRWIGYLPQDVSLMAGTVAENIGRMALLADSAAVVAAARAAGAHEMILRLPQGYETPVGEGGVALSGGQRQRIGLARALYGDPALVILDEPDAHLDADGEGALAEAVADLKQRGKAVAIMAHRPRAIGACDNLLVLDNGRQRAFGPREEILRDYVRSRTHVVPPAPHVAAAEA